MKRVLVLLMLLCMVTVQIPTIAFASSQCEHVWDADGCQECGELCEHVWDVNNIQFSMGLDECSAVSFCTICKMQIDKLCTLTEKRTEPTCTSPGKVVTTATVVINGETYTEDFITSIESIDHVYENDSCIYCGDQHIFLDQPVLKASGSASGIKVSWGEVPKAGFYELYRKIGYKWEKIAVISADKLSYTDKDIVANAAVWYKLKAVTETGDERYESEYSESVKYTVSKIFAPTTVKAERFGYTSVKVSWSRVYPATGYRIYRSTSGKAGTFKSVKTITDAKTLSWKNTGLTTGKKYYYKVRPFYGKNTDHRVYGDFSAAKSAIPNLSKPVMKAIVYSTSSTIKVSWNKVSYASGYTVYRKTTDGSWKRVGNVKGNSTFSFKDDPKAGVYLYAVKAYRNVDGKKVYSSRADQIQTRTLKTPTVTVTDVEDEFKHKVTWTKATGASQYQVWRKVEGGNWKLVDTLKSTESRSVITAAPHGKEISFRVRAVYKKDDVTTYSSYSKTKTHIISYEPYYSVSVPSASKSKLQYITLTITNMGDYKMKILKEGAIVNPEDEGTEKEMVLVSSSTNKTLKSLTIDPGETRKVKLKVVGGTTKYNRYYMVGFTFHYDGQDYVGISSAYYGNFFQ